MMSPFPAKRTIKIIGNPIRILLLSTIAALHCNDVFVTSLSTSRDIKIVGLPGGQTQSLPGMYVQSFRRWIIQEDQSCSADDSTGDPNSRVEIEPIEGAGASLPDEGWVNPTSLSELWWPSDLAQLQVRPTLNFLFKNSVISYASSGLDVRVPHNGGDLGRKEKKEYVQSWRNYGLHSQPIARQWTTLDIAMEKLFHVEGFLLRPSLDTAAAPTSPNSDSRTTNHQEQDWKYQPLFPSIDASFIMTKVANFIAEMDSGSPLSEGFHIVSFPMMDSWTDLPKPFSDEDGKIGNSDDAVVGPPKPAYKLVCLATSEPFAEKLLGLDEDLLTMSSTSVLEVDVTKTAKGGDSPYLTEPYKRLYLG